MKRYWLKHRQSQSFYMNGFSKPVMVTRQAYHGWRTIQVFPDLFFKPTAVKVGTEKIQFRPGISDLLLFEFQPSLNIVEENVGCWAESCNDIQIVESHGPWVLTVLKESHLTESRQLTCHADETAQRNANREHLF